MNTIVTFILLVLIGIVVGALLVIVVNVLRGNSINKKSLQILENTKKEADKLKRDSILETKEELHKLKMETERELKEKKNEIKESENRLTQRESNMDKRDLMFQKREGPHPRKRTRRNHYGVNCPLRCSGQTSTRHIPRTSGCGRSETFSMATCRKRTLNACVWLSTTDGAWRNYCLDSASRIRRSRKSLTVAA